MLLKVSLWLLMWIPQPRQLQVVGEVVSDTKQRLEWVSIESIDRRFVDYTDIDFDGKFVFKNVPEGIYKVTIGASGSPEQQRTIEVRPALADGRGRVSVKIELKAAVARDRFKVGVGALGISPKAVDEFRRASEAKGDVEKARRHLQKAIEISP